MAVYANLFLDQGTDFSSTISLEGATGDSYGLTGYTIRAQMRKTYTSSRSYDFVSTITNPVTGLCRIEMGSELTSILKPGRYVYDVEVISPLGIVFRVVEGQVDVTPRVTRPS
jgi:hypothetical protein